MGKLSKIGVIAFWLFFCALLSYAFVYSNRLKLEETIEEINIEVTPLKGGEVMITKNEVLSMCSQFLKENVYGKKLRDIDMTDLETLMEKEPLIARADVFVDAGGKLNLEIVQRNPYIRVMPNGKKSYYLDKEGNSFRVSKHYSPRVQIVTGYLPEYNKESLEKKDSKFSQVYQLVDFITADDFWSAMIEQIYIDEFGDFILVPKIGDQKIIFGNMDDMGEKFENLRIFYTEGLAYEGWNKYKTFNLKVKGQVIAEKK